MSGQKSFRLLHSHLRKPIVQAVPLFFPLRGSRAPPHPAPAGTRGVQKERSRVVFEGRLLAGAAALGRHLQSHGSRPWAVRQSVRPEGQLGVPLYNLKEFKQSARVRAPGPYPRGRAAVNSTLTKTAGHVSGLRVGRGSAWRGRGTTHQKAAVLFFVSRGKNVVGNKHKNKKKRHCCVSPRTGTRVKCVCGAVQKWSKKTRTTTGKEKHNLEARAAVQLSIRTRSHAQKPRPPSLRDVTSRVLTKSKSGAAA